MKRDRLESEDVAERRRALLVLWALFYEVRGALKEPVVIPNRHEFRKLSVVVWDQLKVSGFLTSGRLTELRKSHEMLDLLVWSLPKDRVEDVRQTYQTLNECLWSRGDYESDETLMEWMRRVGKAP